MASARKSRERSAPRARASRVLTAALGGLLAAAGCQVVGDFDEPRSTPEPPPMRLAARASYACAWVVGGQAQCWGKHPSNGGLKVDTYVPAYVADWGGEPLAGIAELALGDEHSCARLDDGHVKCWGSNEFGQLGALSDGPALVPVFVEDGAGIEGKLGDVVTVSLGRHHSCALLADGHGRVVCWGSNEHGQLGAVTEGETTHVPVVVEGRSRFDLTDAVAISLGSEHSCALLDSGHVMCWGSNAFGQLGRGVEGDDDSPGLVEGLERVEEISLGGNQSCARLADGHVKCWGEGYGENVLLVADGQADGDGLLSDTVELDSGGSSYNCVRGLERDVKCWRRPVGPNKGMTGDDASLSLRFNLRARDFPDEAAEPVTKQDGAPLDDVAELALGEEHGCARRSANGIWCWGSNASGQLGNPTSAGELGPVMYPLPVEGLTLVGLR